MVLAVVKTPLLAIRNNILHLLVPLLQEMENLSYKFSLELS